jgi:hypothetical protein
MVGDLLRAVQAGAALAVRERREAISMPEVVDGVPAAPGS